MPLPLVTDRLIVRAFLPGDLDALAALYADPEVMRWAGGTADRDGTRRALELHMARQREDGLAFWALLDRASGALIGDTGLGRLGDEIEVGWTLARHAWGRGLATEAGRAVIDEALGPLGLGHVVATIHPANAASVHVAEKLGMRPDGRMERDGAENLRYVAP
jgi:ribosomal-protein-alanine N-acetyltransferase